MNPYTIECYDVQLGVGLGRAQQVRTLRRDEGRAHADVAARLRGPFSGNWDPSDNALAGQALCIAAAERLGERGQWE